MASLCVPCVGFTSVWGLHCTTQYLPWLHSVFCVWASLQVPSAFHVWALLQFPSDSVWRYSFLRCRFLSFLCCSFISFLRCSFRSVCGLCYSFLPCSVCGLCYSFLLCVALQFPLLHCPYLQGFLRYSFAVSFVVSFATVLQFLYSFAVSFVVSFATVLQFRYSFAVSFRYSEHALIRFRR